MGTSNEKLAPSKSIKIDGIYKHYKGGLYKVLATGRHSETLEELVIYQDQEGAIWARPLKMFLENVLYQDKMYPRFRLEE